jgi:hypothetical protein
MILREPIELSVPFKGARDYLHSTDIFNAFFIELGDYDAFEMVLYQKMVHTLSLVPMANVQDKSNYSGLIFYTKHGENHILGISENKSERVQSRVPYDEESLVCEAKIDTENKSIELAHQAGHSFVDHIVALNKNLLQKILSSDAKWALTKLELDKTPMEGHYTLKMVSNLGTKLVKSAIDVDGEPLGFIYFSDWAQ